MKFGDDCDNNEYNYLSNNSSSVTIDDLSRDTKILRANEKAIYNYRDTYNKINVKGGILQYPCELISESPKYNKAGDDCVRYVFTVLNSIDPQFVERISKTSKYNWSNINTGRLYNDVDRLAKALVKNGFKVYDSIIEIESESLVINKLDVNFKLEKGDIICRDGHIHIYIGDNETANFGWGKVNRYFPAHYIFSIENVGDDFKIKMDKGKDIEYYTRVYRYEGENAE